LADPGLIQALDYILNRSDEATIEALAAAVVRRRRDLNAFGAVTGVDHTLLAKNISSQINSGINSGIDGLKDTVREMVIRIIKEHAPDISEKEVEQLCDAWIPSVKENEESLPGDLLLSMIEQFISFSHGTMSESIDENLRKELGEWPKRYWAAFPPVIRGIVTDYLKERITEKEFKSKTIIALGL
jgi:hypothetical protein